MTVEFGGTRPVVQPAIARLGAILPINRGATYTSHDVEFILLEDGSFLLLEDGICKVAREDT